MADVAARASHVAAMQAQAEAAVAELDAPAILPGPAQAVEHLVKLRAASPVFLVCILVQFRLTPHPTR